jgi:hypothetical protein
MSDKKMVQTGQAVNNVDIKDMTPKPFEGLTHEEVMRLLREREREASKNYVELVGTPRSKELIRGQEIIDKATGLPKLDSNGNVMHYSDKYFVDITYDGGVLKRYPCSKEMYEDLQENLKHRFVGYLGAVKNYGNEETLPIFTSWSVF